MFQAWMRRGALVAVALILTACVGPRPARECPPPPGPWHAGPMQGPGHPPGQGPGPRPDPAFRQAMVACAKELGLPAPPAMPAPPDRDGDTGDIGDDRPGMDGADAGRPAPPPRLDDAQRERLHACLQAKGVPPPPDRPGPPTEN